MRPACVISLAPIFALLVVSPVLAGDILAARTLRPGTVLDRADLKVPEAAPEAVEALLGLEVRRAIFAGRAVTPSDLGSATLVRRNAVVQMLYRQGALSIRTEGRALEAGARGTRIRVMNLDTRTRVVATVSGVNLVEVHR